MRMPPLCMVQYSPTLRASLGPPECRATWRRPRPHLGPGVAPWVTQEFAGRGLAPPRCTPAALARALERERQLTILFRPHVSDDSGVYGLVYRPVAVVPPLYVILFRPTYSRALSRLILFHELAHILFGHPLADVPRVGAPCGFLGTTAEEAVAEAFGVGAMQYSFLDVDAVAVPAAAEDDCAASAFGQLLMRTQYRLC